MLKFWSKRCFKNVGHYDIWNVWNMILKGSPSEGLVDCDKTQTSQWSGSNLIFQEATLPFPPKFRKMSIESFPCGFPVRSCDLSFFGNLRKICGFGAVSCTGDDRSKQQWWHRYIHSATTQCHDSNLLNFPRIFAYSEN